MFKKSLFLSSILSLVLFAQTAQEYNQNLLKGFESEKELFKSYKNSQMSEFKKYKKAQEKVFNNYKKKIAAIWKNPKMTTKTKWVSYSKDKKTRSDVDFKNQTITIQTIASSKKEAKEKLKKALKKTITIDHKTFEKTDPLEIKLSKIPKPFGMIDKKPTNEPIISDIIFKTKPKKKDIKNYITKKLIDKKIKISPSKKLPKEKIYTIKIQMPKDALIQKSKHYYADVKKQALKEKLPIPLIFAIIHSESYFNPRARSNIPAYGLMQIVPRTAGIDAYRYLYNKKRLLSSSYLYDSKNNITMGSAYLHILYYKYLKKIKNKTSRLYCTIVAYNTGAGNIAWAFTKTYSMHKAAPAINSMTPQEVYNTLLRDLRYKEAKRYLQKVDRYLKLYQKIYKG